MLRILARHSLATVPSDARAMPAQLLGVTLVLLVVLFGPFLIRRIEQQLEAFLFVMGLIAATVSQVWDARLVTDAVSEPIMITAAVLLFGLVFYYARSRLIGQVERLERVLGFRLFFFLLVVGLGLLTSLITAIVASLLLVELVGAMNLDKRAETGLVIISCFAIGLGAVLTPIGEPLATIAAFKLRGEPYYAGFWFLLRHLGAYVVPGILALGGLADFLHARRVAPHRSLRAQSPERVVKVFIRAAKVYVFVAALVLLGAGFKPIVDAFVVKVPAGGLYWINMISAIVDNATLTAAEVGPELAMSQIVLLLMGLLISGGMLIPGNIPNIVAAGRLGITSRAWARLGVPIGLAMMAIYFPVLILIS